MLILTEAELRRLVPLDAAAVDCVEHAFAALATEAVAMPTLCDLTRTGVQDTAIADLACRRAREAGAGREFDTHSRGAAP